VNGAAARNAARYAPPRAPGQTWFTPEHVLQRIAADLGGAIDLDPCPSDPDYDGLAIDWGAPGTRVFVNPPYGRARAPWVDACVWYGAAGLRIALLIPAATETTVTQRAMRAADAAVFVASRLGFAEKRPNGTHVAATHGSVVLGWNTALERTAELGLRMRPC
jgi:hypothetical protein